MPRGCGCGGCSCVIQAGSGAAVTGAGSAVDPYVVALAGTTGGGGGGGWDPGDTKWTARPAAPAGWLIADGRNVSRTLYPALFAAISTRFGAGDGSTTFALPDLTGRVPVGADGTHPLGTTGGAEAATLATANLPAHTHSMTHTHQVGLEYNTDTARDSSTNGYRVTDVGNVTGGGGTNVSATTGGSSAGSTGSTGSGDPVPTMPPYTALTPLIKT